MIRQYIEVSDIGIVAYPCTDICKESIISGAFRKSTIEYTLEKKISILTSVYVECVLNPLVYNFLDGEITICFSEDEYTRLIELSNFLYYFKQNFEEMYMRDSKDKIINLTEHIEPKWKYAKCNNYLHKLCYPNSYRSHRGELFMHKEKEIELPEYWGTKKGERYVPFDPEIFKVSR